MTHSETARKLVHVGAGVVALAFRWLTWWQAAAIALAACVFNTVALPRVAPGIVRDHERRTWSGIHFYPLAVLLLVLAFPRRLDIAGAGWAIMAAGDGASTLAGTRWPGARLPWNPRKTWSGLLAFIAAGAPAAMAVTAWIVPGVAAVPDPRIALWAAGAAAVCAAFVETLQIRLDDNLSVPAAAAAVLAIASGLDAGAFARAWPDVAARLPAAVLVNLALALAAVLARSLTLAGGLAGAVLGTVIYAGTDGAGWMVLGAAFALTVAASRAGHARKAALGIAEERGGRRDAGNVLANCLVGAVGAVLAMAQGDQRLAAAVLVAALAAGASDTVASEIGKAFGGRPRALPSWRAVPPGTPGAVSPVGTAAGVVAAAAMGMLAAAARVPGFDAAMVLPVTVAATAGAFVESLLAGWLEPAGIVNNDVLNFITTAVAAIAAAALTSGITG